MTVQRDYCPITGEKIMEWRLERFLPRKRPTKNQVQFDVQLSNGALWVVAMSENGFQECVKTPELLNDLLSVTIKWWLFNGYHSAPSEATIKEVRWNTKVQGLRVR